ncbi:MAG: OmpA family protein [Planctomycetes bacterium]|nr:OmpA family protein [Planctomycetota bacterium]
MSRNDLQGRAVFKRHSARWLTLGLVASAFTISTGCFSFSRNQFNTCEVQNRALNEQAKAHLAEIANLKAHSRKLEDQLIAAEEDLSALEHRTGTPRTAVGHNSRDGLGRGPVDLASGVAPSAADQRRLSDLAQRYPELRYDPQTCLCKLDVDVLFSSGEATLDADSRRQLAHLAKLVAAEGDGLHVMVVGHTDDLPIAGRDARGRYADNWQLSTARALSVADYLQRCGLRESQLGVAGFGRHEPVADNVSDDERQRNRRVEVFLSGPDTPVVGWTKTLPNLYR